MFKFLLKRKTGFGSFSAFASTFLALFLSFFFFDFDNFFEFFEFFEENTLLGLTPIYFQIIFFILFELILKKIKKYRENTPYKIYTIKENNKEIEVREYPTLYMREYYYNGKLHRESGFAVEISSFSSPCLKHGKDFFILSGSLKGFLFLNGKKQTEEEFIYNIDKVKLQHKALSF